MDNSQQGNAGFSQHVMNQMNQIAASSSTNRNGNSGRRGGRTQPNLQWNTYQGVLPSHHFPQHPPQRAWNNTSTGEPPNTNSYPPLGAQASSYEHSYEQIHPPRQSVHVAHSSQQPQQSVPTTPQRASIDHHQGSGFRGGYRGHGSNNSMDPRVHQQQSSPNEFRRPQPTHGRLYNTGMSLHQSTPEQQRAFRHKIMSQSDFLGSLASQALKNQITQGEYQDKEAFRRIIQTLAQNALKNESQGPLQFNVENVKLRLYGSLGSGFGVAGSDMDLLLTFPQNEGPLNNIEIESRRWLEKYLLDAGYGARLLTNTRVPILKVCEKPSAELLQNLRDYRKQWEDTLDDVQGKSSNDIQAQPPLPAPWLPQDVTDTLEKISLDAAQVPLPRSPTQEIPKLDFVGDCGIQCDINFTNYVALRNTELLRTYGACDPRVRQVGLFIKHWAKARDINTPYKGTLSSYGYVMMVLHYLMNVVNPPLIPNLQALAREQDEWDHNTSIERIEGFDVRFIRDPQQLRNIMSGMVPNRESLGSLLRGFFWYYGCHGGFHWIHDVISIRTPGGQLTKQSKGWTKAGNQQTVRLRYLLAIEDPFEVEHNIGRTVGHNGIVAIRDEFRRAWSIIEGIQFDDFSRTWFWSSATERKPGDDFMEIIENRGDLLRKDQEAHREKLRQMKQAAEAKEQALKETSSRNLDLVEQTAKSGTCKGSHLETSSQSSTRLSSESRSTKLIDTRSSQDQERTWRTPYSRRQVLQESEASDEEMTPSSVVTSTNENSTDDPLSQKQSMWLDLSEQEHQAIPNRDTTDSAVIKESSSVSWESGEKNTKNLDWGRKDYSEIDTTVESWDSSAQDTDAQWYGDSRVKRTKLTDETKFRSIPQVTKQVNVNDDMIGQQQSQFKSLGDAIFARSSSAQTRLEPHSRGPRADKKVGRLIFWDQQTEGGKWLRWRDNLITSGHWMPPKSDIYVDLDARYPFDPEMSYADLHAKNEELRRFYSGSLRPEDNWEQDQPKIKRQESIIRKHKTNVQERALGPNQPVQTTQMIPPQVIPTSIEKVEKAATPDEQSVPLMKGEAAASTCSAQDKSLQEPDIHDLRALRVKHFSQMFAASDRESTDILLRESAVNRERTLVYDQPSSVATPPTSKNDNLAAQSTHVRETNSDYPDTENHTIPPAAQQAGFNLDPRQLQDLEIIQQGGNGCARQGEQFSIEENYEFGGGGAMGYKSSSGIPNDPLPSSIGVSTSGEVNRELLNELPRTMI